MKIFLGTSLDGDVRTNVSEKFVNEGTNKDEFKAKDLKLFKTKSNRYSFEKKNETERIALLVRRKRTLLISTEMPLQYLRFLSASEDFASS